MRSAGEVFKFKVDDKSDRCFIIITGTVAVFRMKDEPDLILENEFYNTAMRIINENHLQKSINDSGMMSLTALVSYLDNDSAAKFEAIEGIRGSRLC